MRFAVLILASCLSVPFPDCGIARAETANLTPSLSGSPGAASRLVLAQRTYKAAVRTGDAVLLLAAIRLARGVTLRPTTQWTRTATGEAPADLPIGRAAPADPAAPETIAIVQDLAAEDPALRDLVYDLDAQLPHGRASIAVEARAELSADRTDTWRIAFSGDVPVELGLIGDGDGPLGMTVTDETGAVVCAHPPDPDPGLCRFTPARNGFFLVTLTGHGPVQTAYRLIAG